MFFNTFDLLAIHISAKLKAITVLEGGFRPIDIIYDIDH
jgi:hypothetical protein